MGPKSGAFSRCRPRFVTFIVLLIVAAPVVVANLNRDEVPPPVPQVSPAPNPSYGWPLIWYECEFTPASTGGAWPARMDLRLVQWSGPRLAGNVAVWCLMLAVAGVACEWLFRRHERRFSYRPRLATLIVLMVVAAPIVLANLSEDLSEELTLGMMGGEFRNPLYGWPLIWRWRNCVVGYGSMTLLDWNFSPAGLAGNLATWLVMLAAAGVACEWLLRRYRPRLRWSLRTMLAAVAPLALLCAWCAALRERANVQDPIIAEYGDPWQNALFLDRWGPKWLDLVGADRFRRRVVGVNLTALRHDPIDEELLKRWGRLPYLSNLVVRASDLTPDTAAVLGEMWQLRMLRIEFSNADDATAHACLASVGKLTRLERLCLDECEVLGSEDLRCLRGLTNLKSLTLGHDDDVESTHEWLAALGELIQLERLYLRGWNLSGDELACLTVLTNLKSLTLERCGDRDEVKTHEWLAALGRLTQLERLCLTGFCFRSDGLACLAGLGNLRALGFKDYCWPDSSSDEDCMEEEAAGTEEDGEITDELENMDKPHLFAHLPALPRLETIDLEYSAVGDGDLARLAVVPRLKSLNLTGTSVTAAGLAELARLECLEELAIDNIIASAAGLESLRAQAHLKALHIDSEETNENYSENELPLDRDGQMFVREGEDDRCRQALEALRQSNPGIVIDSDTDVFNERRGPKPSLCDDAMLYQAFYGW